MGIFQLPSGPLLRPTSTSVPSPKDIRFQAPGSCSSTHDVADILEGITKHIYVTGTSILLANGDSEVFLEKKLAFLEMQKAVLKRVQQTRFVTIPPRANVFDDFEMDFSFKNPSDCDLFLQTLQDSAVPPQLQTNIYLLQGDVSSTASACPARLIADPELQAVVDSVMTALAYSDSADILSPIVNWSVLPPNSQSRRRAIGRIQQGLQSQTPPSILILPTTTTSIPSLVTWYNDPKNAISFPALRQLPLLPTWTGSGDAPDKWLSLPIENYGIHTRHENKEVQQVSTARHVAISFEIVDWFLAACAATKQLGLDPEDQQRAAASLAAATASLKMTVVHEIAHMYVAEEGTNSPERHRVQGADHERYDVAESSEDPGHIEAGYLVETAWMGGVQELGLNSNGWLELVLTRGDAPNTDESLLDPTDGAPSSVLGSPFQINDPRFKEGRSLDETPHTMWICSPELVSEFNSTALPTFTKERLDSSSVCLDTPIQRRKTRVPPRSSPSSSRIPIITTSPRPRRPSPMSSLATDMEKPLVIRMHNGPKCRIARVADTRA